MNLITPPTRTVSVRVNLYNHTHNQNAGREVKSMNRAEQKLVLELCRFQNPDVDRINYLKKQGIDQAAVPGQLI